MLKYKQDNHGLHILKVFFLWCVYGRGLCVIYINLRDGAMSVGDSSRDGRVMQDYCKINAISLQRMTEWFIPILFINLSDQTYV